MAGHSKWKNIKHKKAAADAVKMKRFTQLSKEITTAAKSDPDVATNPTLRVLIEKANRINMPKENYLRAIKKASGAERIVYETSFYQGYGPANVAIIVEVLSDNKNRAVAEVRRVFTHNGGRVAEPGAVEWMFKKAGLIEGETLFHTEEELLEELINFKLYEYSYQDNTFFIAVDIADFTECKEKLESLKCTVEEAHIGYTPFEKLDLTEEEEEKIAEFVSVLESVEDIKKVYINA